MAIDATLTRIEKNSVLQIIQKYKFDPAEFEWSETVSREYTQMAESTYKASRLTHRATGYYITFGGVFLIYSPGNNRKVESGSHSDIWANKLIVLDQWLRRLRAEVDAPDLWAAVGKERELSEAASSHLENTSFTAVEKSVIVTQLEELKHYVLSGQQFQIEQAKFIDDQFAYLRESSQRLGRKDWLNLTFSTLVTLAVTLALPNEKAIGLLQLAGSLLKSLWHLGQGLLQGA